MNFFKIDLDLKVKLGFSLIYSFVASLYVLSIWNNLDLTKMDLAGHISSAVQFSRGGLHGFNDRMFLGATHNLFYPPLEDLLINFFKLVSFQDFIISFKLYLTVVLVLYMFIAKILGDSFKSATSIAFFHTTFIVLFNYKKTSLFLQGLGGHDLVSTGLTNQFLGGIFFFLICREIIKPSRNQKNILVFTSFLAILSHIVVGLVCLMLVLIYFFFYQNFKTLISSALIIIGISAFYVLPMFYYREFMTTNNIFDLNKPWVALCSACFVFSVSLIYKKRCALSMGALILLIPLTIVPSFEPLISVFPDFHYYRLTIFAFILVTLAIALWMDQLKDKNKSLMMKILSIIWLVYLIVLYPTKKIFFSSSYQNQIKISPENIFQSLPKMGRTFLIDKYRPIGTGIDSLLTIYHPDFKSSKGLFWESSYTNNISSSYLATLLGLPSVLNYYRYSDFSCLYRKCFLDKYLATFNITKIISNNSQTKYLDSYAKFCNEETFIEGTKNFQFLKAGKLEINQDQYEIYEVRPRNIASSLKLAPVEIIDYKKIDARKIERDEISRLILTESRASCELQNPLRDQTIYLKVDDVDPFQEYLSKQNKNNNSDTDTSNPIQFNEINENVYEFNLPHHPSWFILKLAPQPGLRLEDESGKLLKIFRSYPYTLSYGAGRIVAKFERTPVMILGYIISVLTLIYLLISVFMKKRIQVTEVQDEHLRSL